VWKFRNNKKNRNHVLTRYGDKQRTRQNDSIKKTGNQVQILGSHDAQNVRTPKISEKLFCTKLSTKYKKINDPVF